MAEVKITESCYEHVRGMLSDLLTAWKEDQAEIQRLTSLCANYREALDIHGKIFAQVYRAVEGLSPSSVELLCVLGSIGDSLSDEDVLECLEQYNEHGTYKAEVLFDVSDTPQDRRKRFKLASKGANDVHSIRTD